MAGGSRNGHRPSGTWPLCLVSVQREREGWVGGEIERGGEESEREREGGRDGEKQRRERERDRERQMFYCILFKAVLFFSNLIHANDPSWQTI